MRVFVTGATGLLGRALCGTLLARGHAVAALSRAPDAAARLPGGVRAVGGDPSVPGPWQDELARSDACVHLAGEPLAERRWTAERKLRIRSSRVDSTRNVADVLRERGPEVLVSASAVGFYGSRGDEVLDESSAPGEGFLAEVCRAWEAAAEPATARARVTFLRTGIVLARGGGALPRMVRPFRAFAGGPLGDGAFFQPWIHLADAIGLAVLALEDERARGPMNATAPEPVRNRELARAIGETLGRPSAFPTPAFAIRLAVGEIADEVLSSQRAVPRKALGLGYRHRFPILRDALADLLG
jgi:uncharacterized protein (TIGR01777 family)